MPGGPVLDSNSLEALILFILIALHIYKFNTRSNDPNFWMTHFFELFSTLRGFTVFPPLWWEKIISREYM